MKIIICMGSSCFSRGNNANLTSIQRWVEDNPSHQASIELKGCRCGERCHAGPNIWINDTCYSELTPETIPSLLNELYAQEKESI